MAGDEGERGRRRPWLARRNGGSLRRTLRVLRQNPALARLSVAFLLFNCAEAGTWIGILVYAYSRGGVTESGLVATAALVPSALLAPVLAAASERRRPGAALALGYALQAATCALVAAAMGADVSSWAVYGAIVAQSVTVTLTRPVQAVLGPGLSRRPEELTATNVLLGWVESISLLVAPAATGLVLVFGSPTLVFAVMAVACGLAALLVTPLRASVGASVVIQDDEDEVTPAASSLAFVRGDPNARMLLLLLGAQFVAIGALDVIYVELARGVLDRGSAWVGFLGAAFGVGGVVGVVATASALALRRLALPLLASIGVWALAFVGIATTPGVVAVLALLAVAGGARTTFDVTGRTLLQRVARPDLLARVFGLLEGLQMTGLAAGSLLAPLLVSLGGASAALVGIAAVLPAVAFATGRRMLRIDLHATVPVVEITLLRSVPLFAALPPPTLESLARALEPVDVAAGAEVVRQGDAGDRYYVISEGELDVIADGNVVAKVGRGDGVGEIALMYDVPRTATVTARTEARLYALEREPFLAAVTGHLRTELGAYDLAEQRLANLRALREARGETEVSTTPG